MEQYKYYDGEDIHEFFKSIAVSEYFKYDIQRSCILTSEFIALAKKHGYDVQHIAYLGEAIHMLQLTSNTMIIRKDAMDYLQGRKLLLCGTVIIDFLDTLEKGEEFFYHYVEGKLSEKIIRKEAVEYGYELEWFDDFIKGSKKECYYRFKVLKVPEFKKNKLFKDCFEEEKKPDVKILEVKDGADRACCIMNAVKYSIRNDVTVSFVFKSLISEIEYIISPDGHIQTRNLYGPKGKE